MKYVKFEIGNGYCGCDEEVYDKFEDTTTEDEIDNFAEDLLVNWYSYFDDDSFIDEEDEDDYESAMIDYQMNCYVNWDYITKEEYEEYNSYIN